MSNHRGPLVASAVALVAALAGGVLVGLRSDPGPASTVAPVAGATPHDALAGSAPRSGGNRSGTSTPSGAPSADAGVERMPESPGAPASRLPGLHATTAPVGDARARVVDRYPVELLPPVPDGRVLSSSVSPSGDHVQAALVAQVPHRNGSAVLRFYRTRLASAGFVERPVRPVGGARAASFTRVGGGVVVTVRGATYSVFATLRVAQD